MEEEGFSGRDGRTTIFDYWSPDTLRAWNNHGKWDDELLRDDTIELRDFYRRLIRLCHDEKDLSTGLYYDLMPANYENDEFDSTSLFAFARGSKGTFLLIVVNFSSIEKNCSVQIPDHAFDFFEIDSIKNGQIVLTPLLDKGIREFTFSCDETLRLSVKPEDGEIYRISLR